MSGQEQKTKLKEPFREKASPKTELQEKAKTKREIWNEPDVSRQKPETSVDTLWVRLEDAQQLELDNKMLHDQLNSELAKTYEWKQKLQEKRIDFTKRWNETPYPHTTIDALVLSAGISLIKEFEESFLRVETVCSWKMEENPQMKIYEITTECGHKIQTAKLTKQEQEEKLTFCPLEKWIKPVKIIRLKKVELKLSEQ